MELCTTELFVYVHFKVKPSMKNTCYNVIVKFIRYYRYCLYLSSWIKYQVSWKMQSCWCYSFCFGSFSWKNFKNFCGTFDVQIPVIIMECYSTNSAPIDKTLVKKLNLETIYPQELNQKIIAMTHVQQMINIVITIV